MIEAGVEAYMSPRRRERKANFGQAAAGAEARRAGLGLVATLCGHNSCKGSMLTSEDESAYHIWRCRKQIELRPSHSGTPEDTDGLKELPD